MELLSPGHLIPLLVIAAILFFGWKQLPDMSRSLGRSLRIFKTEIKGMTEDDRAREQAKEQAEHDAAQARAVEAATLLPPVVTPDPAPVTPVVAPQHPVATPAHTDGTTQH